ncbi:MAG: rubrerythrin family protein [Methanocorpusculum sp.]|uniref:Rubrerythrin family protein n=1 Tax=Methanocorpusculum petauri TaxID=3002863 RepID=A0ABT4IDG4_9EURY|nr:ferritin family protein [Methanocorpusculum petauri]MCZ9313261.1 rubrerythrin family protein [Methanocorpusculum sp.]MCZ0859783.1 rubrerythrin family protein [Methanocorpusculum petauri]MDE2443215.1 rubrerythrin family protein [Methanocorpusculum sp.]MDE2519180.1 rubrerythrin family protein [Methanocorpusculum sp.]MDE2522068.1 rubrerythrin family protein [Methanocorpusculum sp.]
MDTKTCIADAFAGESQANRKYKSFSEAAADEGYDHVAKLFRATSAAEEIHARRLLRVGGYIGTTVANLEAGMAGELHETNEMYPSFIKVAEAEGRQDALITFEHAMKAEAVHADLYKQALEAVKAGRDFEVKTVYLCPVCGNIEINKTSDRCPICGIPGASFKIVE